MSSVLAAAVSDRAVNELWWIGMIESVLAIFFGITAIFWPGLTLLVLVYLFGAFVLALGNLQVFAGIMSYGRRGTWWVTLLLGILGIGVGVYLLRNPDVSLPTFILLVGLLLVARGLFDITRAILDRSLPLNRILLAVIGVSAIVAGIFILLQPETGGVAFVWVLGVYALILGMLGMAIALGLRALLLGGFEPRSVVATENTRRKSRTQTV